MKFYETFMHSSKMVSYSHSQECDEGTSSLVIFYSHCQWKRNKFEWPVDKVCC